MKHQYVFVLLILSCILIKEAKAKSRQCCDDGDYILYDTTSCLNNKSVSVSCNGSLSELSRQWVPPQQYLLRSDSEGQYLYAHQLGFMVREPNFCEGILFYENINQTEQIAVICDTAKIPKNESQIANEFPSSSESNLADPLVIILESIYEFAFWILSLISFILLIIAALLYCFIQKVQDPEGICIFHLTLNLALCHGARLCASFFGYDVLVLCTITMYVEYFTELVVDVWAVLLSIIMWSRFRENRPATKSELNFCYRCSAYGIPVLIMGLASYSVYLKTFPRYSCIEYRFFMAYYLGMALLISFIVIGLFSFLLIRKLQYNQSSSLRGGNSLFLRKMRYRMHLFVKLYLILGVPRIVMYIFDLCLDENNGYQSFIYYFFSFVSSMEGMFIFLLLVPYRPRVRQAIARGCCANCKLLPARWRTENDPESEQENDTINLSGPTATPGNYTTNEI